MKTIWVKVLILLGVGLFLQVVCADQPTLADTTRLALSLDELVDQQPSVSDALIKNGKRSKALIPPVPLQTITPVAARILKMDENELRNLLIAREKLSLIAYARLLAGRTNKPWPEVLKDLKQGDPLEALQKGGVPLADVHKQLDELYTELAFAALDVPLEPDQKPNRPQSNASAFKP